MLVHIQYSTSSMPARLSSSHALHLLPADSSRRSLSNPSHLTCTPIYTPKPTCLPCYTLNPSPLDFPPYDPLNASNRLYVYPINGKLVAYSSSPACAACALYAALVSCWSISSMGKYCVSMLDCSLGSNGARMRRRPSHETPRKKGCCLISLAPPRWPRRCSESHIRLEGWALVGA